MSSYFLFLYHMVECLYYKKQTLVLNIYIHGPVLSLSPPSLFLFLFLLPA